MISDLQCSWYCLSAGRKCDWAASNLVRCFELGIRKQFDYKLAVVHIRKIGWKQILFIGCIEIHNFKC